MAAENGGSANDLETTTIVLVGNTGCGKSTLGNHLLGVRVFDILPIGTCESCTSGPRAHTSLVPIYGKGAKKDETCRLRVIDTPGLGDSRLKSDLEPMIAFYRHLVELKQVSYILFCIPFDSKLDAYTMSNLAFYRRLFRPLMDAGVGIMFCFTRISQDVFLDVKDVKSQQNYKKGIEKCMEMIRELNINPDAIEFFGLSAGTRDKEEAWKTRIANNSLETENYILDHSVIARDRVLQLASQRSAVSTESLQFTLPPQQSVLVPLTTRMLHARLNALVSALEIDKREHAEVVQNLLLAKNNIVALQDQIVRLQEAIKEFSRVQKTPVQYLHSHSLFGDASNQQVDLSCYGVVGKLCKRGYNARWERTEEAGEMLKYSLSLKVEQMDQSVPLWFIQLWLEFDASKTHEYEIKSFEQTLRDAEEKLPILVAEYESHMQIAQAIVESDEKLPTDQPGRSAMKTHLQTCSKIWSQLEQLNRRYFSIDEAANIVSMLS